MSPPGPPSDVKPSTRHCRQGSCDEECEPVPRWSAVRRCHEQHSDNDQDDSGQNQCSSLTNRSRRACGAIRAVLAGGRGRLSGIPSTTRAKTPLMVLIVQAESVMPVETSRTASNHGNLLPGEVGPPRSARARGLPSRVTAAIPSVGAKSAEDARARRRLPAGRHRPVARGPA
jgi:hypothetical protein